MLINRNCCSWLIALCGLCLVASLAWGDDRSITPQESDGSRSETNDGAKYSEDGTILLGCPKDVKSFTIPSSVTEIRVFAFSGCGSLESVTIPSSVTKIEGGAFRNCRSLESIEAASDNTKYCSIDGVLYSKDRKVLVRCPEGKTSIMIPSSVTEIEVQAFYGCSSLESIEVASDNTKYCSIDGVLYSKNRKVLVICPGGRTSLTIPSSVKKIGIEAFHGCNALTSVTIPSSVTKIGVGAFFECGSLANVTIPSSVTRIKDGTFCGCGSLANVTIPSSVTEIGELAFSECGSLSSITIPSSVTEIGGMAFKGCGSLASITIPSSVTRIGVGAFADCSSLGSIEVASDNAKYCGIDGVLYSEDQTVLVRCPEGKTSITIPSSVTEIGGGAFYHCSSLGSIEVASDNAKYCGIDGVLYSEDQTVLVRCPEGKTSITIPSSVTKIGRMAFYDCGSLESITIPSSVTEIGVGAFKGCGSLASITIPSSVTKIGSQAFSGCGSLASITIPTSVMEIESATFYNCRSLTSITIPSSVTRIDNGAFMGCGSLASITIPSSVTEIGREVFGGCGSLASIEVASDSTSFCSIDGVLYSKDRKVLVSCSGERTSLTIPSSVTEIGEGAFIDCGSLASITIPSSVTKIGFLAFSGCPELTLIAERGSTAWKYAEKNDIPVQEPEEQ